MEINKEIVTLIQDTNNKVNLGDSYSHQFVCDFSEVDPMYQGTFVIKYPNQIDRMTIGVKRADLTRGLPVDIVTDNLITMISTLDTILTTRPDWFNITDPKITYDMIYSVYMQYIDWQETFRKPTSGSTGQKPS